VQIQNVLDGFIAIRKLTRVMNAVVYFARRAECFTSNPTRAHAPCDRGGKRLLGSEKGLRI
jgi:hypothetical protein